MYDIAIIGAGPAGLTAGIYARRAGKSAVIFESSGIGGQIAQAGHIENYPACPDILGIDLSNAMYEQAEKLGCDFAFDAVTGIERIDGGFNVKGEYESHEAKTVIIATGAYCRHLGVEGEERLIGRGVSYCAVCDGNFYRGRDVVVVGGGNSALEETLYLSRIVNKVYLVHRRDAFRGAKIYEDKIRETSNIELVTKSVIDEIRGGNAGMDSVIVRNVESGETRVIEAEGLFVYVGMLPVSSFVPTEVTRDAVGFIVTDAEMATSVPGIFAAGDVRSKRCRQVSSAVGDGATAATAALTYLEHWNA
jgi:thioredoxin reductase (NADPH)